MGDWLLLAPALAILLAGSYSDGPTFTGALGLLLAALVVVRSALRRPRDGDVTDLGGLTGGLGAVVALVALLELLGPLTAPLGPAFYALLGFGVAASHVTLGIARGTSVRRRELARPVRAAGGEGGRPSEDDLDVVESALSLLRETCTADLAYFLERIDSDRLEVIAATDPSVTGRRVGAREGIAASVLACGQPVLANRLRGALPGSLDGRRPPLHVLGAPVGGGRRPEGVLLLERREGAPFDEDALRRAQLAARLLGASLSARRRVERVTDAHYELERFFDASRLLNSALTPEDVYASTDEALGRIGTFAFTAVTWAEEAGLPQRVVHARGAGLEALLGRRVDQERTVAAMVAKSGHYLPLGCEHKPGGLPVLCGDEVLGALRSLIVLPLRVHDAVRGTLAVGALEAEAFPDQRRGILEVIANQLAVSLANARTYARVQEMATLDGLTGLFNRRSFELRLDEGLARAGRTSRPLALVMLDIDHFKSINDTHGHPVGDAVLREVGATIRRLLRRTDLAARYGGEEFSLVLEDTDATGAMVMAERLREEAAKLSFVGSEGQRFGMTVSLGIAAFPGDADAGRTLVERADGALYEAKRGGRNQARLARQSRPSLASLRELRRREGQAARS